MPQRTPSRLVLAWTLTALTAVPAFAQTNGSPKRYTAVAMDLDRGQTARLQLTVNRWSTEAQRAQLMSTMLEKGPDALLETLQKQPTVGTIQVDQGLGWDLRFAWRTPGEDGGERIILATDRPMSFWEVSNRPRTVDYPFTIIELHVKNGEGDGTLSLATKVIPDKDRKVIVLENFDTQRIRLTQVRAARTQ